MGERVIDLAIVVQPQADERASTLAAQAADLTEQLRRQGAGARVERVDSATVLVLDLSPTTADGVATTVISWLHRTRRTPTVVLPEVAQPLPLEVLDFINRLQQLKPAAATPSNEFRDRLRALLVTTAEPGAAPVGFDFYIDTDDERQAHSAFAAADLLAAALGFEEVQQTAMERGSFTRRALARLRRGVTLADVEEAAAKAAYAPVLNLDKAQAEHDAVVAGAVAAVLDAVGDSDSCMVLGQLMVLAYRGPDSQRVVLARLLTMAERQALADDPEMIKNPASVLESLQLALDVAQVVKSQ